MKDYYKILEITPNSTAKEIKQAYRKKAKELHPDNDPTTDSNPLFNELVEAYETISDPNLKRQYDLKRTKYNQRSRERVQAKKKEHKNYTPQEKNKQNEKETKSKGNNYFILTAYAYHIGNLNLLLSE